MKMASRTIRKLNKKLDADDSDEHYCNYCDRYFKTVQGFNQHMKRHKPPGGYACQFCENRFCTRDELVQHKRNVHAVFRCEYCKSLHETLDKYQAHVQQAHDSQERGDFVCEKCGKKFITKLGLKNHRESKCGTSKRFKCDECEQTYMSRLTLSSHKLIHTGQKFYCCSFCGKQFISQGELKVHERKHTKEKPFQCDICKKSFPYRESLVTHTSTHTGIKPYACSNCNKTFSCIGNLQKHRKARPHTCGLPRFCQETKRIVPRVKTRKPKKIRLLKNSRDSASMKSEFLDLHTNVLEESSDAEFACSDEIFSQVSPKRGTSEVSIEYDLQIEGSGENDVVMDDGDNMYLKDHSTSDLFSTDHHEYLLECDEQTVVSVQGTDYETADSELEQYAVELLEEIDEASMEMNLSNSHEDNVKDSINPSIDESSHDCVTSNGITNETSSSNIVKQLDSKETIEEDVNPEEIRNVLEIYECPTCNLGFISLSLLIEHLLSVHEVTDDEIDQNFASKDTEQLECPYCDKKLYLEVLYLKHVEEHAKIRTKDELTQSHSSSVDHVCTSCGKTCPNRSALREHETSKCGTAPQYKCEVCDKLYYSLGSLKTHKSVHTGDLPYLCSYCGKSFRTKGQHAVHIRKHTGEKPFKCHICPKAFPYRQSLVTHITTHTGEKPFVCHCGLSFSCVKNLLSHRKTFRETCGALPANTKPVIQIGVVKGQLYVG